MAESHQFCPGRDEGLGLYGQHGDCTRTSPELRQENLWEIGSALDLDPCKAVDPELMFHGKRAVECARLLAAECDASDPSTGLYGEGFTIVLLSTCFQGRRQKENSGLSVSQLRLVLDFIHEHLDLSVSVFQLSRLVDLLTSQFARMFKASTGVSSQLSTEHPDRQSAGTTADERREPFHGGCGNRFCRLATSRGRSRGSLERHHT
jgi:hypothetical protein